MFWIKNEFGLSSAICTYIMLFLNQWLIASAKNLYWSIPTFFFPFLVMMLMLRYEESNVQVKSGYLFIAAFLTIFIRSACGHEFISNVMISLELPLIYYAYKNGWEKNKFVVRFVGVGISAVLAFFLAIGISLIQSYYYFDKSWLTAVQSFVERVSRRTGMFTEVSQIGNEVVRESLSASKWSVILEYLNDGIPLIGGFRMNILIFVILIAMVTSWISNKYSLTVEKRRRQLMALDITIVVGFLGPISWFVLASGHAYVHPHICYILWSTPFLVLGTALFGATIPAVIMDFFSRMGKQITYGIVGVVCACSMFLYINNYSRQKDFLDNVKMSGVEVARGADYSVYYLNQDLYYFNKYGSEKERFFLHIYTQETIKEGKGFHNRDFSYTDNALDVSFLYGERVSKVELSGFTNVEYIETGQFDIDKGNRFWEIGISMDDIVNIPNEISIVDLNDANWVHGINRSNTNFLLGVENWGVEKLVGKTICIDNELITEVVSVQRADDYFWIFTKDILRLREASHVITVISE